MTANKLSFAERFGCSTVAVLRGEILRITIIAADKQLKASNATIVRVTTRSYTVRLRFTSNFPN